MSSLWIGKLSFDGLPFLFSLPKYTRARARAIPYQVQLNEIPLKILKTNESMGSPAPHARARRYTVPLRDYAQVQQCAMRSVTWRIVRYRQPRRGCFQEARRLRDVARRDAVRWPGAAWRAAPAWRGCPAWRDATRCAGLALRGVLPRRGVRCPGCVAAQHGTLPRPGVAAQRGASPRLA